MITGEAAIGAIPAARDHDVAPVATADGIPVGPIHAAANRPTHVARDGTRRCGIIAAVDHPEPDEARALLRAELAGGADGLALRFAGAAGARGFGLPASAFANFARLFEDTPLDRVDLRLETPPFAGAATRAAVAEAVRRARVDPARMRIGFGLDPIGDVASTGVAPSWRALAKGLVEEVTALQDGGFRGPFLRADARPFHEAGATEAQELASVVAAALSYLRALDAAAMPLDAARGFIGFVLVADVDVVVTAAKCRALRLLWARIEEACGLAPKPISLHAETAWRALSRVDPWANLLRGTAGCFAAMVGGVDSITVLPFTAPLGLPDAHARRLARNTLLLMRDESAIGATADPGGGAGAFEALTAASCEKAWEQFGFLEREGGLPAALARGSWQDRIASARARRGAAVARRALPLTGTSTFAEALDRPTHVVMAAPTGVAIVGLAIDDGAAAVPRLPSARDAEPFERLRDRADAIAAATGRRPGVVCLVEGESAATRASLAFAGGVFAVAGIVATSRPWDGGGAGGDAAVEPRAVLCLVADPATPDISRIASAIDSLPRDGRTYLILSAPPETGESLLRSGLVDALLFDGCDIIALLDQVLQALSRASLVEQVLPGT